MPVIVMPITLSGCDGFVGAAPATAGFQTLAAREEAILQIKAFYGPVEKMRYLSLACE